MVKMMTLTQFKMHIRNCTIKVGGKTTIFIALWTVKILSSTQCLAGRIMLNKILLKNN